ncbi:MAG: hypothetical protein ACLSFW_10040 [Bacteroides cellulosilyticus]
MSIISVGSASKRPSAGDGYHSVHSNVSPQPLTSSVTVEPTPAQYPGSTLPRHLIRNGTPVKTSIFRCYDLYSCYHNSKEVF